MPVRIIDRRGHLRQQGRGLAGLQPAFRGKLIRFRPRMYSVTR